MTHSPVARPRALPPFLPGGRVWYIPYYQLNPDVFRWEKNPIGCPAVCHGAKSGNHTLTGSLYCRIVILHAPKTFKYPISLLFFHPLWVCKVLQIVITKRHNFWVKIVVRGNKFASFGEPDLFIEAYHEMLTDMTPAAAGQLYPQLQSISKTPVHGHVVSVIIPLSVLWIKNEKLIREVQHGKLVARER